MCVHVNFTTYTVVFVENREYFLCLGGYISLGNPFLGFPAVPLQGLKKNVGIT